MWESKERGVLLYTHEELSRLLRLPEDLLKQKLKQLSDKGIYSVRESDGAIFNRRMIKDQDIREKRSKSGYLGGINSFASKFAQAKDKANTEYENEIENENVNKDIKRFTPPVFEEVKAYCVERKNSINPQNFIDFYESKGWMIGKNKMKCWKSAVRNWESRTLVGEIMKGTKRKEDRPIEYKKISEAEQKLLDEMMAKTRLELNIK